MSEIPEHCLAPFHESANQPKLLVGCEPWAIGLLFMVVIVMCFSIPTFWGLMSAGAVFLFGREVLRELAKIDPIFTVVYSNAQRYNAGFWQAKANRVK